MPPKIAQRNITITPEFIDGMIAAYSEWIHSVEGLIRGGSSTGKRLGLTVAHMLPIVRRQNPGLRSGLDYEISRLRSTPYTEFTTYEHNGPWLVGVTKHITIRDWKTHEFKGELGPYWVAVPLRIFTHPNLGSLHLIPTRNFQSKNRHPHHYLVSEPDGRHPLDVGTGNCYGDYSGTMKGLLDEPDIPELFRQLHRHLSTFGDRPPVSMYNLDFDHETPEAIHA